MVFFLFFIVFMLVCTIFNALAQDKRQQPKADQPKEQRSAAPQASAVDMTPPVLTQQTTSTDQVSTPVSHAVASVEAILAEATTSAFVTEVHAAGSKVTRKGTANDPAKWACLKSFYGSSFETAPQAIRSTDPQRQLTAKRLFDEAVAKAAKERKAAARRAKKFQDKLKEFRQGLIDAAVHGNDDDLLEHHLREAGVL